MFNYLVGVVEVFYEVVSQCEVEFEKILGLVLGGLEIFFSLVRVFKRVINNVEKEMVKFCFEFFGIFQVDVKYCQIVQNDFGFILRIIFDLDLNLREKKIKDYFLIMID